MPSPASAPAARPTRSALLTLGRLPVALEIARALHAHGWRVVVAEPLAWHLCRLSRAVACCRVVTAPTTDAGRYAEELLAIVREERISLVVPVLEETLYVAALHGRLPAGVTLACPRPEALRELHDKWRFAALARELGLTVPDTALADSEAGARIAGEGPHVIKPRLSCAGIGVTLTDRGAALPAALRRDAYVVQRRLPGAPCCAFAFARAGGVRTLVVYRSLLEAGSVSVTFERIPTPDDVAGFVATLVEARGASGMLAFDFIADANGRYHAIECNPRATSGLHLLAPRTIVAGLLPETLSDGEGSLRDIDSGVAPVGTRRQEFWSALGELEWRTLRGRCRREEWRRLFTTRDVDWSAVDRKPFLLMTLVNAPLLWRAIRARRPITEVAVEDMVWGEAAASEADGRVTSTVGGDRSDTASADAGDAAGDVEGAKTAGEKTGAGASPSAATGR